MPQNPHTRSHHDPIRLGTGAFRILALQPSGTFSSGIVCTLTNVSLESHPAYDALSYVWGDKATLTSTITLQGKPKAVTENLAVALRHLRLAEKPRNLWVDALCINQEDVSERDDQVVHMKEIYQHCVADLIWLGEDASIIEEGIKAMEWMGPITQVGKDFALLWMTVDISQKEMNEYTCLAALEALFGTPKVWHRVWIMQEVSFAPRVKLVAGHNVELPWERVDDFLDVEKYIEEYGLPDAFHQTFGHGLSAKDLFNGSFSSIQILAHQRRIVAMMQQQRDASPPTSSLLDVLARFRHTEATDPRDKVFALLGLTSNPLSITPTYHDSTRSVYTQTALAIINASRNLDLLCQSPWGFFGTHARDTSLPSWVPDFANPTHADISLFAQRGIYAPAGRDELLLQTPCVATDDGHLPVEGWDAGVLRKTYPRIEWRDVGSLKMPDEVLWEGIEVAGNESLRLLLSSSDEGKEEKEPRRSSGDQGGGGAAGGRRGSSGAAPGHFERYWRTIMLDCKRYPVTRLDEDDVSDLRPKWEAWLRLPYVMKTGTSSSGKRWSRVRQEVDEEVVRGIGYLVEHVWRMRFAVLEDGGYAMVPGEAEKGDRVAVLKGAKTPVVLRRAQEGGEEETWTLIGPCYVHALMDGQIVEKGCGTRTFVLS